MCWVSYKLVLCLCRLCSVCVLSHVRLLATPWSLAYQAPLSLWSSRQEHWSGLPRPPPGDLPHPGIEPTAPVSPVLARRILYHWAPWQAQTLLVLWGKWIFSLYNTCGLAEPVGSYLQRPTGETFTVTALCGRWWKGTGLARHHSAGILSRRTVPDFGKAFRSDCLLLWVSSWSQKAGSYLETGVRTGWGRLFLKGVSVSSQSFWKEVDSGWEKEKVGHRLKGGEKIPFPSQTV